MAQSTAADGAPRNAAEVLNSEHLDLADDANPACAVATGAATTADITHGHDYCHCRTGSEERPHATHCLVSGRPVLGGLHTGDRADLRPGHAGLMAAQVDTLRAGRSIAVGDNGAGRVRLSPGPGDVAMASVTNTRGNDRIRLRVETTADGQPDAGISILTAGDNPVTMMWLGTVAQDPERPAPLLHAANLILRGESGHDRIRLLVADNGTPKIGLISAAGALVWSAP